MQKLGRLQLQCFRFAERLYGQLQRLKTVRSIVEILTLVQLVLCIVGPTIPRFDNHESLTALKDVISYGYKLTQKQSYSFQMHLAFQLLALLFFFSFLTCILYHGPLKKNKSLQSPLQFLITVNALFLVITPAYFIIIPRHIFQIFNWSGSSTQQLLLLILLPCQIFYTICGMLILRDGTLVTPIHLAIPIFEMFSYSQRFQYAVAIVGCLISIWINKCNKLIITCNVLLLSLTFWVLLEETLQGGQLQEQVMGITTSLLFLVACCSQQSYSTTPTQNVQKLKTIIDSCQKPESNRYQFYLQKTFIEHLPSCSGDFCSNYHQYQNKTMLQLNRDKLRQFLIQKLIIDSKQLKSSDLKSKLSSYKFEFNPKNQLKFYSAFYKSDQDCKCRGNWLDQIVEKYRRFELLRHFRLILERQNMHNLPLIQDFERSNTQEELFSRILSLLIKQDVLWRTLAQDQQNHMLQEYVWDLHVQAKKIHGKYNCLHQPPNESRRQLYRVFCQVTHEEKPQNSLWTGRQLLSSQQQSNYIISDPEIICKVSSGFLRKFHYKQGDLLNEHINILLPIHLHNFHDKKIVEWDGMEKRQGVNKFILNGEGFIERVQFSWLVYPFFEEGLRYVSFISSQNKEYLLLYNSKEDHIVVVSQLMAKLMEEMGKTREIIQQQKSQDLFKNVDLKGVALKVKGQLPFELLKIDDLKGTIHLIGQYNETPTELLLIKLHIPDRQSTLLQKLTATTESFRDTLQKIKQSEQADEVKALFNYRSRTSKILILINALYFVGMLSCIVTAFVNSVLQIDHFRKEFGQLQVKLDLNLCFARIMSLSSSIELLEKVKPSNMPESTFNSLIFWRKEEQQYQIQLLNQMILSRIDNHVQILEFTQTMTDKIDLVDRYIEVSKILDVNFATGTQSATIVTLIYSYFSIIALYLVVNILMTIRVQQLLPHVRSLLTEMQPRKCLRQAKQIGMIVLMNLKCQNISEKIRKKLEKQHRQKIKKDEHKEKFEDTKSKLKILLENNFIMLLVTLFSVLLIVAIGLLIQSESNQNQIIKQIQNQNYQRAIDMVRIQWLLSLTLLSKSNKSSSGIQHLFQFSLNQLNYKSDKEIIALQLPANQFGNIPSDLWHLVNQDICKLNNIKVREGQKTCEQLGSGSLLFGQQKAIVVVQNILRRIMELQKLQQRYNDQLMYEASEMIRLLAQSSQYSAKVLCQTITHRSSQKVNRLAVSIVGYIAALVIIMAVAYYDTRRKQARVGLLRQFFRLVPSAEFDLKKKVKLWWKQQNLIELIRAI